MVHFCIIFLFDLLIKVSAETSHVDQIKQLVAKWAPLIWMSPEEKYFPSSVNRFFTNVRLVDQNGKFFSNSTLNERHFPQSDTASWYLVTKRELESESKKKSSFLNGYNPRDYEIPIYALVTSCTPHISFYSTDFNSISDDINILYGKMDPKLYFHVTYWSFYPYNKGKNMCFLGKVPSFPIFGRCFGHYRIIGSHVGDWERMSLSFKGKAFPDEMFLSIHDTGGYYRYDPLHRNFKLDPYRAGKQIAFVQKPKLPPRVRVQNGHHPVLFSAEGSHGLWPAPGEHEFVKIAKLSDKCGYGVPWKTWKNLEVTIFGVDRVPDWMYFKGRWGNPSTNCILSAKLGLCEYTAGPPGIIREKQDFYC